MYNSIMISMYPLWERLSEHSCLSPLRGPSTDAISGLRPSSQRGERRNGSEFQTTVTESFRHPRFANYKAFATVYFVLKLDINWLQTKPAK